MQTGTRCYAPSNRKSSTANYQETGAVPEHLKSITGSGLSLQSLRLHSWVRGLFLEKATRWWEFWGRLVMTSLVSCQSRACSPRMCLCKSSFLALYWGHESKCEVQLEGQYRGDAVEYAVKMVKGSKVVKRPRDSSNAGAHPCLTKAHPPTLVHKISQKHYVCFSFNDGKLSRHLFSQSWVVAIMETTETAISGTTSACVRLHV